MLFWGGDTARETTKRIETARRAAARALRRLRKGALAVCRWLHAPSISPQDGSPSLTRWFGVVGFVCILVTSMATALALSSNVRSTWLAQDESAIRDFVHSAVAAHEADTLFARGDPEYMSRELEALFQLIAARDPVFLAHFYSRSGRIFWSSDPGFVGRQFAANDELVAAMSGRTMTELASPQDIVKPEHHHVQAPGSLFLETYVPVFDRSDANVVGVIEVYRSPAHLEAAIDRSTQLIWIATLTSGLALYLTLGWVARWGDRRLAESAQALSESNSLAAIGEVATAVAHGLRNPLAAMRSSAELALDAPEADQNEALREVMQQTDRLDRWITALVGCLRTDTLRMGPCDVGSLLAEASEAAQARIAKAGLSTKIQLPAERLTIEGNRTALLQVLDCLIANAMEATPRGGALTLACSASPDRTAAQIAISDTGPGPDSRIDPFTLFLTTKGSGLGVGLPIARRLVERHHGRLTLAAGVQGGAVARLEIPLKSEENA